MKPWEDRERAAIVAALKECAGYQNIAAGKLGFSPRQLHYKIRKYGIPWRSFRPAAEPIHLEPLSLGDLADAMINEALRLDTCKNTE